LTAIDSLDMRRRRVADLLSISNLLSLHEVDRQDEVIKLCAEADGFRIATSDSDNKDVSHQVIVLRFINTSEALMQGSPEKGKESSDLTLTVS
jgi:hypothetical protein